MVMKPSVSISIEQFINKASEEVTPVNDVAVEPDWRFSLEGSGLATSLKFGPAEATALSVYQVKNMARLEGNITKLESRLRSASLNLSDGPAARTSLEATVASLNCGLDAQGGLKPTQAMARTFLAEGGRLMAGGVVSRQYVPIRHLDLISAIAESPDFKDAQVMKFAVTPSRMEAMVMLDGAEWKVDGGLKAGISIHNGQFGDKSYGYLAMLFRLLCTNGMMDVVGQEGASVRRHYGGLVDIREDVSTALSRTKTIAERVETAVEVEVDVVSTLVELHRRRILDRGPLKSAVERRHDLGGGGQGGDNLWSLTQAVSAAARQYSYGRSSALAKLSGRLFIEGSERVIRSAPLPIDAPEPSEVLEYIGLAA